MTENQQPHINKVLDDKVKHLQLVNAVSSNDVDAIINAIFKINANPPPQGSPPPSYGSPLHLVVSLCQKNIVENILHAFCSSDSGNGTQNDWIVIQNTPEKETPLHIASKLSRSDVVELLFQLPNVNDTIRDCNGHTAEEVATTPAVQEIFER
jgi:ankyrin repeat protein